MILNNNFQNISTFSLKSSRFSADSSFDGSGSSNNILQNSLFFWWFFEKFTIPSIHSFWLWLVLRPLFNTIFIFQISQLSSPQISNNVSIISNTWQTMKWSNQSIKVLKIKISTSLVVTLKLITYVFVNFSGLRFQIQLVCLKLILVISNFYLCT